MSTTELCTILYGMKQIRNIKRLEKALYKINALLLLPEVHTETSVRGENRNSVPSGTRGFLSGSPCSAESILCICFSNHTDEVKGGVDLSGQSEPMVRTCGASRVASNSRSLATGVQTPCSSRSGRKKQHPRGLTVRKLCQWKKEEMQRSDTFLLRVHQNRSKVFIFNLLIGWTTTFSSRVSSFLLRFLRGCVRLRVDSHRQKNPTLSSVLLNVFNALILFMLIVYFSGCVCVSFPKQTTQTV